MHKMLTERISVALLALLSLISIWLSPWAALSRETGARSTLLLLPDRIIDFTGRTEPLSVPGMTAVLVVVVGALLVLLAASVLKGRLRYWLWLVAGLAVLTAGFSSLTRVDAVVNEARRAAFVSEVESRLERPRDSMDLDELRRVVAAAPEQALERSLAEARAAGVNVRRLPYNNSGMGLAAFLSILAGGLAVMFSARLGRRASKVLDRLLTAVAVPASSIFLALLAAAVVVLSLQPTALGRSIEIATSFDYLVGRLDTLWYAYQTLFADSLGTFAGFLESLKFTTPLIFTGLAVAFGFQAGLFNIGAPGQMVLGAIFAMFVGVYMPGPRLVVLPLAVFAAALGGGLWGALPGWLKARYGANEVINTILLNYIAASLLLFVLSSNQVFAAPALRVLIAVGAIAVLAVMLNLIPTLRHTFTSRPRLSFAVLGVLSLIVLVFAGLPRAGDQPVDLGLPFKAPGSEPKSYPLSEGSRLSQLPALMGIDLEETPGVNDVPLNMALIGALVVAALALVLVPRLGRRLRAWPQRVGLSLGVAALCYGVFALLGWQSVPVAIPPTKLNSSFLLALASAVFMYFLMWRTKWGYELRAVGLAPKAAEYGGASIAANTIMALTVSGAFAGLTATHYVLGGALEDYSLRQSLPTNDGFDGIAVALLGGNTPLGVVLSAFLFGVLKNGGSVLNITFSDLTRDVVNMILALVVLFIAAKGFLPDRLTNPLRRQASELHGEPPQEGRPLDPPAEPVRSEAASAKKTAEEGLG